MLYFVKDWRRLLLRSYSQWGFYLGFASMAIPSVLLAYGYSVDPFDVGLAGLIFYAYGAFGRLIDQNRSGRGAKLVFLAVVAIGIFILAQSVTKAVYEDLTLPPPVNVEQVNAAYDPFPDPQVILAMGDRPIVVTPPPAKTALATPEEFLEVAIPFVGKWEGLRLTAYQDIVGVWTVCYGETKGVTKGMTFSKKQCDDMLARELINYRKGIHRAFFPEVLAGLLPVYRDVSYTDLSYNVGIGAISKSTAVRRLNAGNVSGGCEAITWFNKAGGQIIRGLRLRRGENYDFCMVGAA